MNRDVEKAVLAIFAQLTMALNRIADAQTSNARRMDQLADSALKLLEEQRAAFKASTITEIGFPPAEGGAG